MSRRRSYRAAAPVVTIAPLLSGCLALGSPVEISRRYDRIENATISCEGVQASVYCYRADLSALPAPVPDESISVTALGERAQAAYVTALAQRVQGADELRAALAAPIEEPPAPVPAYADGSEPRLRFVLGLFPVNGYLNAGDRLAWAKVTIVPLAADGYPARFVGWTQAANAFDTVDIGSVTAGRTEKLTGETGLNIAKFLADTKVGVEVDATREEKADIKDRVTISAQIAGGSATIVQTGGWRRDLAGNATFDATIALPPADTDLEPFTTLGDLRTAGPGQAVAWTAPAKLSIGRRLVRMPPKLPLCALVTLDFVVRHVVSGDRSFSESNDRVQFLRGLKREVQNVASPPIAQRWFITRIGSDERLQYAKGSTSQILTFSSKSQALAFIAWMQATGTDGRVGGGRLFSREGRPLDKAAQWDAVYPTAQDDWRATSRPCPALKTPTR